MYYAHNINDQWNGFQFGKRPTQQYAVKAPCQGREKVYAVCERQGQTTFMCQRILQVR